MFVTSRYNYLLFHSLAELYSIVIAMTMFLIAWNARDTIGDKSLVFLGIAYFFIGILDIFHTLSYKGMNIYSGDIYYANQIWIGTRIIECLSLLAYALMLKRNAKIRRFFPVIAGYGIASILLYVSVFILKVFPTCFVDGQGQTIFKVTAEYLVIIVLLAVFVIVRKNKARFPSQHTASLFELSVITTALSELLFTLYTDNYGITNVTGHLLKILSYYFIYKAIIETSIVNPYQAIFGKLTESNSQKDRLISIIGHDLTNLISGISTNLDILADPQQTISEQDTRIIHEALSSAGKKTLGLLQNILMWARSLQGTAGIEKERIYVDRIIRLAVNDVAIQAGLKGITIDYRGAGETGCTVDENMIHTVFRNILSNGIKFTQNGGTITITVEKTERGMICAGFRDSGIGMSDAQRNNLFSLSTLRHSQGTNGETGSGFGLLLVNEFVSKHGGTIEVNSTQGKGTEFRVYLPE